MLGLITSWKPLLPVLLLQEGQQLVVDVGALWLEEARAWAELVEEEEVLMHPDLAVVPLGGLLLEQLPLLHQLVVGEGDAVDPLQGLGLAVALPVGGAVLGNCH